MKKIFCFLPGLALVMALSGCCANNSCNCGDELADALLFRFEIGGTNGFAAAEVDTLYIVRITHPSIAYPNNGKDLRDSVSRILPLTASGAALKRDSIVINNAAPFSLAGGNTKLSAYDYEINAYQVKDSLGSFRITQRFSYRINNIKLDGRYNANGCCTCYLNTKRQFDISSRFLKSVADMRVIPTLTTVTQKAVTAARTQVVPDNVDLPSSQTPTVTDLTR